MKKELLLASFLMASPVANLTTLDIAEIKAATFKELIDLKSLTFFSKDTILGEVYRYNNETKKPEYITMRYRYKVEFYPIVNRSDIITDDGLNLKDLEYEAVITKVDLKFNEIIYDKDLGHFYVKRIDENSFQIYDCDSTKTCNSDYSNVRFHIGHIDNDKMVLHVDNQKGLE
jgi:ubiquinone biosynthesis protein Coq4